MSESNKNRLAHLDHAAAYAIMSAVVSVIDTSIVWVLAGVSIPIVGIIGMGIGFFVVAFSAFACCQAASRVDEELPTE